MTKQEDDSVVHAVELNIEEHALTPSLLDEDKIRQAVSPYVAALPEDVMCALAACHREKEAETILRVDAAQRNLEVPGTFFARRVWCQARHAWTLKHEHLSFGERLQLKLSYPARKSIEEHLSPYEQHKQRVVSFLKENNEVSFSDAELIAVTGLSPGWGELLITHMFESGILLRLSLTGTIVLRKVATQRTAEVRSSVRAATTSSVFTKE